VSRGSVQLLYRRTGGGGAGRERTGGGAAGIRVRQGCGVAGALWLGSRESTAVWRARVGRGRIHGAANRRQQGRSGPIGVTPWRVSPAQGCPAAWRCFSAGRSRAGEGREEGGREREKDRVSN
jgi:hypothetical protein